MSDEGLSGHRPRLPVLVSFALVYALAQLLGNRFYFEPENVATLWPASGVLVAFLLGSRHGWATLIIVATLVQATIDVGIYGRPAALSLLFCTANVTEATLGALLLRRVSGSRPDLGRVNHVLAIAIGPALIATAAGAAIGASTVTAWFPGSRFWDVWQVWWLADAVGVIAVAPAVLGWLARPGSLRAEIAPMPSEAAAMVTTGLVTLPLILGIPTTAYGSVLGFPYLVYPFLLWAALRFGPACASAAIVAMSLAAVGFADAGVGPFRASAEPVRVQVLAIQAFLLVTSVCVLVLAASSSERRRAQRSAETEHRTLQELLAGSLQGVVIVDGAGRPIYANDAFAEMLGFDGPDDVVAREQIDDLLFPAGGGAERPAFDDALRSSPAAVVHEREVRRHGDGKPLHLLVALRAGSWQGQSVVQAVMVDITERKRGEIELARHRDRLEELVSDRTRQLESAHESLLRAERLAALGNVMATVSHELRNPLGTIQASALTLRAQVGEPDTRLERMLGRIERNVDRCVAIIREMLDYARTGVVRLDPVVLDACVAEILDHVPLDERIRLERSLDSGATIRLDRQRFEQVLANLLSNASHAMLESPGSTPTVRVETATRDGRVELHVVDNGRGMSDEETGRAFEPLYSTRSFGIGLGLPMVERIMEEHGGGVEIESCPSQGTRVVLWLPTAA